jgi:S-adenosylmethionine-diacylglycerol 3-amino-3-carboxypropyl transferase
MAAFFQDFNYSLANEDTRVEQKDSRGCRDILAVCGSGARVIPLLHKDLKRITVVDTSSVQLDYLRLKHELVLQLDDADYLKFLGYRHANPAFRENILKQIDLDLRRPMHLKVD